MVEQAGFEAACAVRNALSHPGDNRFSLARITIGSRTTTRRLASLLSGTGLQPAEDRDALITKTWRSVRKLRHAWQS